MTTAAAAVPAIVSGPTLNVIDASRAQVVWRTDAPATSVVEYGPTSALGAMATAAGETTLHVVDLPGLLPATRYHVRATSVASACGGGRVDSADTTLTTRPATGAAPPAELSSLLTGEPLLAAKRGATAVALAFDARADASGYNVYVGDIGAFWSHATSAANVCRAAVAAAAPGRLGVDVAAPSTSSYFLATAFNCSGEGAAGATVPATEQSCAP